MLYNKYFDPYMQRRYYTPYWLGTKMGCRNENYQNQILKLLSTEEYYIYSELCLSFIMSVSMKIGISNWLLISLSDSINTSSAG